MSSIAIQGVDVNKKFYGVRSRYSRKIEDHQLYGRRLFAVTYLR